MKLLPLPALYTAALVLTGGLVLLGCGDTDSASEQPDGGANAVSEAVTAADSGSPAEGSSKPQEKELATSTGAEPVEIAHGQRVELVDHLVAGQITVFDFTSPYCPPCRQINPWLERLHRERSDVSVVKVNINRPDKRGIDWGSPVARQYGLQSIPAFTVYDAEGEVMADGNQAKALVIGWLQKLAPDQG